MRMILTSGLLAAILFVRPGAAVADERTCPIDRVVAIVRLVEGDAMKTHIKRGRPDGDKIEKTGPGDADDDHARPGECLLYGDRLEAGPGAVVTIETTKGKHHVGGSYDPVFEAPEASEAVSPGAMSYVASLYRNLFGRSGMTVYATGRALDDCRQVDDDPFPLVPLDRLAQTHQQIGADLDEIVAAWKPSVEPHFVRATLRGRNGNTIARAETCGNAHIAIPLRPGDLRPKDVLTLEIVDGRGETLDYQLTVVEAKDLPVPPGPLPSQWLIGAWRLAAGPPDTRLDSISRLQSAPPDSLAAQNISESVWLDSKF